jgi:hypothetical protein
MPMRSGLNDVARDFSALLDYEFRETFRGDPAALAAAIMRAVRRESDANRKAAEYVDGFFVSERWRRRHDRYADVKAVRLLGPQKKLNL